MIWQTKLAIGFILILVGVLSVGIYESLWFLIMIFIGLGFETSAMKDRKRNKQTSYNTENGK